MIITIMKIIPTTQVMRKILKGRRKEGGKLIDWQTTMMMMRLNKSKAFYLIHFLFFFCRPSVKQTFSAILSLISPSLDRSTGDSSSTPAQSSSTKGENPTGTWMDPPHWHPGGQVPQPRHHIFARVCHACSHSLVAKPAFTGLQIQAGSAASSLWATEADS